MASLAMSSAKPDLPVAVSPWIKMSGRGASVMAD